MVRNLILQVVGGVVVRSERLKLSSTGVNSLEDRADTQSVANTAHNILRRADNLSNLSVRETVTLSQLQSLRVKVVTLSVNNAGNLIQQHQLIQEPRVNLGRLVQLLHGSASQQSLLNLVNTLSGRNLSLLNQLSQLTLRQGQRLEREGRTLLLQRTHRLLQSLSEVTAQSHSLANTLHGGGQSRVSSRELLKREARNLHDHVVEGRLEGRRGLLGDIVRNLIQGVTQGQLGRNLRNREAGSLRRERRGTRHARVHLNDDDAAGLRVNRELDVTTTGVHANLTNHVNCDVAQLLELTVGQGQCGCHSDGVTGVHAHGVEVFDGADDHDVVVGVTHHLQLVFLPAEDGLLQQDLAGRRVLNTGTGNTVEVFLVVRHTRAETTHGEGGADHHRVAQLLSCFQRLRHGVNNHRACRLAAGALHHALECFTVLTEVNRLNVRADQLNIVLGEHAALIQGDRRVQRGLTTQGRQDCVRLFLLDNLLNHLGGDGFNVGGVRELGVGHDGCRVRVHEDDAHALLLQHAQCLSAGVVKFRCLTDDDGAGTDDEDAIKVSTTRHLCFLCSLGCDHQVDETVKEVGGIVRARSSLGVVLHGERGDVLTSQALNHVVVQTHVGDHDLTELGVRCGHVVANRRVHSEAVVLRGDFNLAGGLVHDRLVDAAVTEGQLVGAEAQGAAKQLVTEADAEERGALTQHALQQLNLLVSGCRVTGAVGEEHAVRVVGVDVLEGCACGQHVHAHATLSETLRGHRLNAQVQGDNGCDRGCEPVELVRLNGVGGVNRNGVSELTTSHRLGGAHLLQQFSFGAFCVLTGEHARTHRTARTQAAGQGASVNALNADDALLDELFVEGALGTPVGCHACCVANHVAGNPNLAGLSVGLVHAGVANMGSGLNHNLTRVGGVGQGFLVAGHTGRENRLAQGRAGCAVAVAAVDGAVLQDEQRAVRTQGAGSCHVSHALLPFLWCSPPLPVRPLPCRKRGSLWCLRRVFA